MRRAALVALAALLAAACTQRRDVELVVRRGGVEVEALRVEIRVSDRSCDELVNDARDGRLPAGAPTVLRAGSSAAPIEAGTGAVTILVTGADPDGCGLVAIGCVEATLSADTPVDVTLAPFEGPSPCGAERCVEGECVETDRDAGSPPSPDGGMPGCSEGNECALEDDGRFGVCCEGACVDVAVDPRHCGGCQLACAGTCGEGRCAPTSGRLVVEPSQEPLASSAVALWFQLDGAARVPVEAFEIAPLDADGRAALDLGAAPGDAQIVCLREASCSPGACGCEPGSPQLAFGLVAVADPDLVRDAPFSEVRPEAWADVVLVWMASELSGDDWSRLSARYPSLGLEELVAQGYGVAGAGLTVFRVEPGGVFETDAGTYRAPCDGDACAPPLAER